MHICSFQFDRNQIILWTFQFLLNFLHNWALERNHWVNWRCSLWARCCPKNQLIFHLSNDWFLKWKPNQKLFMSITKFTTSLDALHLHQSNKGIVHVIIGTFNVCSFLELGIILNFGWLETVSDRKVVALSIALSFFHLVINATDFVLVNYNWIKMLHASKNNKWNRKNILKFL